VSTVVGADTGRTLRGLRLPLLIVAVILVGAVLVGLAQARVARGELDPDAVDPAGSHALAVLLGNHGVAVRRVDTVDEAAGGGPVLVAFPGRLAPGELRRLAGTAPLVLVAPDAIALREVTDAVLPTGSDPVLARQPDCAEPAAVSAGDADLGGRHYDVRPDSGATTCYGGALALATTTAGNPLVVLGTGTPLRNEALAGHGNAALALGLLGDSSELRWLVTPPGAATGDEQAGLVDLVPPWVPAAALQLLLGGLLVALWRSRRLGPPVPEPLPVVVRAAETVEGRARLYRRGGARDRAAEALRSGALARIVPRLRLGTSPPAEAVVAAVSARTGRTGPDVGGLLYGAVPVDDPSLVRLADALDDLCRAVLR
jgi:hypothetical protein